MTDQPSTASPAEGDIDPDAAIAIVGLAGRFPGADSVEELWANSLAGTYGLRRLTDEELLAAGVSPAQLADPAFVRVGGPIEDVDAFDAGLFGLSRREAELTDPQHRLFAESCVEALEHAGYPAMAMTQKVGVFAGCGFPDYMWGAAFQGLTEAGGALNVAVGMERDSLSTFVSYKLGLTGPSLTVQTFCSTSLVAVHLAMQALFNFECDMALAGGVYLPIPQKAGYRYEEGGIYSADGSVLTFDAAAGGSVMGSGVCVVALKRLSDAIEENCHISAVLLGSAVNNDGRTRVGFTAPGVDGEAKVISDALTFAGASADSIDYVECHGTGTMLGDSVEIAAMTKAFAGRSAGEPVVLGSLKPYIGHLDRAAGVTSLARAALALRDRTLPAVHHYRSPNPALLQARGRFEVLTAPRPWPVGATPRRAGVSAFGLGGANAHVVLQEPPTRPAPVDRPGPHVVTVSARDEVALDAATRRLATHLRENPDLHLADVAYTQQVSRSTFPWRRAVVVDDLTDAVSALETPDRWRTRTTTTRNPVVTLVVDAGDGSADDAWSALATDLAALAPANSSAAPVGEDPRATAAATAVRVLVALGADVRPAAAAGPGGPQSPAGASLTLTLSSRDDAARWLADAVTDLWQAGCDVRWGRLHGAGAQRLALPTYPFQRGSYWIDPPDGMAAAFSPPAGRAEDVADWTYAPTWQGSPAPVALDVARLRESGPWLVLAADDRGEAVATLLRANGSDVAVVRRGAGFAVVADGEFTAKHGCRDDLELVLDALPGLPTTVVDAFPLAPEGPADLGLTTVQAVVAAMNVVAPDHAVNLVAVTESAGSLSGEAPRHPAAAAIQPFLTVVAQENPGWTGRHVDVDAGSAQGTALAVVNEALRPYTGPVLLRGSTRWSRRYDPQPLPAARTPLLEPGSTVLVTGALGHVGLILARHLALTHRCRLVLTSRRPLPPREEWAAHSSALSPQGTRLRTLLDLEKAGAQFEVVTADVADASSVQHCVDVARERFGGIDLVVHAAGVSDPEGFGPAHFISETGTALHLDAKLAGFDHLEQALDGTNPPSLAFSSLSVTLGGLSLASYAASNAALDARVLEARARGRRWAAVQWDTWEKADPSQAGEFDMRLDEALDLFDRAVSSLDEIGVMVVSTGPLEDRVDQWVVRSGQMEEVADNGIRDPRPDLSTPYVEPAPGTEADLAEVWAAVLRLEKVGVDDNFFLLGGTSVLAIGLAARIRREFTIAVPTSAVMGFPTVRGLAEQLEQLRRNGSGPAAVADDPVPELLAAGTDEVVGAGA